MIILQHSLSSKFEARLLETLCVAFVFVSELVSRPLSHREWWILTIVTSATSLVRRGQFSMIFLVAFCFRAANVTTTEYGGAWPRASLDVLSAIALAWLMARPLSAPSHSTTASIVQNSDR